MYQGVGPSKAATKVFAKRTRRNHPSVAKAVLSIDNENRKGLSYRRVLEAIIEQNNVGPGRDRGANSGSAVAGDPASRARRKQQSFIPDRGCIVVGAIDPHRPSQTPAISAGYNVRIEAFGGEKRVHG